MAKDSKTYESTQEATPIITEISMPKIEHVSARAMTGALLELVQKLQSETCSNQSFLIDGVPAVWVAPKKTLFYGKLATPFTGETLNDAVKAIVK